jgi:hypothetical protein
VIKTVKDEKLFIELFLGILVKNVLKFLFFAIFLIIKKKMKFGSLHCTLNFPSHNILKF